MSKREVYLDFAATSAVRPPEVSRGVADYLQNIGATPGRGSHRLAIAASRIALQCRMVLARELGIPGDPGRIAWMMNATHAINTALFGVLRRGEVLVTTVFDHNAVLRPAHVLAHDRNVHVRMIRGAPDGSLDMDDAKNKLIGARLLVINAVSNVLGTRLPVADLAALAHDAGAIVLVDAAQAAGHDSLDAQADQIDMLAITGHKGLLGPQGIGALWVSEGVRVDPLLTGGTGGDSLDRSMPQSFPDHLEAGTQNGPAIAGLLAALHWLGLHEDAMHDQQHALALRLYDAMSAIEGVTVLSPRPVTGVGIVTIISDRISPSDLAERLDREHRVMARSGLHCAPEVHKLLGTDQTGALRFSIGWCTTDDDIDYAAAAVAKLVRNAQSAGAPYSPTTLQ